MVDVFKYFGGKKAVQNKFAHTVKTKIDAIDDDKLLQVIAKKLREEPPSFSNIMSMVGMKLEDVFGDFTIPEEDVEGLKELMKEQGCAIPYKEFDEVQKLKLFVLLYAFQNLDDSVS
ncbi:MAG: hypothetical protein M0R80_00935 [Proteobacteria bacterium]|jgi:hypothetical protein|nr:hypothetical protein [Pseudomonadota bacterium]